MTDHVGGLDGPGGVGGPGWTGEVGVQVVRGECPAGSVGAPVAPLLRGRLARLVVGPPLGNWGVFRGRMPGATPTRGTFTLRARGGLAWRLWRFLATVRPIPFLGGALRNRLGLPNPGLPAALEHARAQDNRPGGTVLLAQSILSIHGESESGWAALAYLICKLPPRLRPLAVELNLSCPNVSGGTLTEEALPQVQHCISHLQAEGVPVIAKLPPVAWLPLATGLWTLGVRAYHCCNTLPTPAGGLSGKPLKALSLEAVLTLRRAFGADVFLIGGGGVTGPLDVLDYIRVGADSVSITSALLNPFRWPALRRLAVSVARMCSADWDHGATLEI